jgi:hypothetical protein
VQLQKQKITYDPNELESKLRILFEKKLLKAENPKFPGCYFVGNVLNTLKKIFPDTKIDEIQLILFAYQNKKFYIHLSKEVVKTQIKYLGSEKEEENEIEEDIVENSFNESFDNKKNESEFLNKKETKENKLESKISSISIEKLKSYNTSINEDDDDEKNFKEEENLISDNLNTEIQKTQQKKPKKNIFGVIGDGYDKKVKSNEDEIDFNKLEEQMNSLNFNV